MELEEKREIYKEIDNLKREQKSFMLRISVIANLFIPGIGFVLYGSGVLKGLISFILFLSYNYLFFNKILNNTDLGIAVLYYVPAIVIWLVSAIMVSGLDN